MSILIKNGRVVTAASDYIADVYIEGDKFDLTPEQNEKTHIFISSPKQMFCNLSRFWHFLFTAGRKD